VRIHLGHHFYGAGNLGDDFMLAGFLAAMRTLAPGASFSCCVPFALEPLRARFPEIEWLPYQAAGREQAIAACDVWLGLGGSPFQSAQSRWFVDHLLGEAELCAHGGKPMFFLGVGVQTTTELALPEIRELCARAAGIWTRDGASATRIRALPSPPPTVEAAADLAHLLFRDQPPPSARRGRVSAVLNFDYGAWPGQAGALSAIEKLAPVERVWLAQESRELPGAERALFAALPAGESMRWKLVSPDTAAGTTGPLASAIAQWPSGEWLLTARFHAAIAGAWAGSKVVTISTNEKLRGIAHDLHVPAIATDADEAAVSRAFAAAAPVPRAALTQMAESAQRACAEFVDSVMAHLR
jgi:polysaccharide pyruvyl transferase WcaK-like protein